MARSKFNRCGILWPVALLLLTAGCAGANRPSSTRPPDEPGAATVPPGFPGLGEDEAGGRRTRRILSRVRRDFTYGIEGLSPSGALSLIDRDRFYDYPRFEEELTIFLRSLGEMRIFIREVDVQMSGDRAIMLVDARMRFAGRLDPSRGEERSSQVTFDFERTEAGWRITEISPRSFFLP